MEDKYSVDNEQPTKICLNCAYRANCQKRFSVSVSNGEVLCIDYSYDLALKSKE
jgi:hypothetical protein